MIDTYFVIFRVSKAQHLHMLLVWPCSGLPIGPRSSSAASHPRDARSFTKHGQELPKVQSNLNDLKKKLFKKTIIKDSLIKGFEDYATHMARSKPTISSETGRTQDLIRVPVVRQDRIRPSESDQRVLKAPFAMRAATWQVYPGVKPILLWLTNTESSEFQ